MKRKSLVILALSLATASAALFSACQTEEHTHALTKVNATAATCTEAGNSEYYTCDCNKYFKDAEGTQEIAKDSWIVQALGHSYEVTEWYDEAHTQAKTAVCANDASHVEEYNLSVTSATLNGVLNDEKAWADYKLDLAAGEYAEIALKNAVRTEEGEGTQASPYLFRKTMGTLAFIGESAETVTVDGFDVDGGSYVKYVNADGSGGVDYYYRKAYEIENLIFKNVTFTAEARLESMGVSPTLKVKNVIFENVVFDFTDCTDANSALHVISENGGIENVVVKDCSFRNVQAGSMKAIGIDCRTQDDINVTVTGCSFENVAFNAIQISGSGSSFVGEITVANNVIRNTGDRAVRISTLGDGAKFTMTGNVMENAGDADGELCKASVSANATVVVGDNFWGAKEGTTAVAGVVNGLAGGENIMDSAPRASAN